MKNIHPLTTAGVGLGVASLAVLFAGYPLVAGALALAGYFFIGPEISKYTSVYQLIMYPVMAFLIGFSLDYGQERFPFFSIGIFLFAFGPDLRLIFYRKMLHTKFMWVEPTLLSIGTGLCIYANLIYHPGWPGWFFPVPPLALSTMLVIGFIRENAVLRKIAKTKNEIDVGISAPDFELPDQYGQPVKLSSFKGMRNVLLIFLRGDWCPACHMMMRTYEKSSAKLREKNILLLAIGPDDLGVNKQMAEKLGIEYRILADAKQEVAIAYGTHLSKEFIPGPGGPDYEEGFPLPSSFLICDKGIIRYRSRVEDVGEFLSPDTVFEVLAKI